MKANYTLALIAVGAVLINSTPLRASEAGSLIELSSDKPTAFQTHLRYDLIESGEETSSPTNEPPVIRFEDEVGDRLAPQVGLEVKPQPATIYSPRIQLRTKPNNVVRLGNYSSIEYSGILVGSVRNNPLQLLNPFAPARYGDGEPNTVRDVITGRAEGLKVLTIHF